MYIFLVIIFKFKKFIFALKISSYINCRKFDLIIMYVFSNIEIVPVYSKLEILTGYINPNSNICQISEGDIIH